MRLAKAREILQLNLKEAGMVMPDDCQTAIIIGIEAIAHVENESTKNGSLARTPLPHETKD